MAPAAALVSDGALRQPAEQHPVMTDRPDEPSVAEHLVAVLVHHGIERLFGLPGTTNLAALEAVRRGNALSFVTARHEQCAAHMADATARLGAAFGAVLVDLGPGLANTMTAVLAAQRDSVPLLVVAGNEERWLIGREVWHEMPEIETFRAMTKGAWRLERSADFPRLLRSALAAMLSGRPGPVLLSVPKDLWEQPAGPEARLLPPLSTPAPPDPAAVHLAAERLAAARRPILLAGSRARAAAAFFPAAVEAWRCPLVSSPNGRGVLAESHPLCLGHAGRFGQRQASRALADADLILAVGCSMNDLATHNWSLLSVEVPVIQVDPAGDQIGRNWPVVQAVVGDPAAFLAGLAQIAPPADYLRQVWDVGDRWQARQDARRAFYAIEDAEAVKPQAVMRALEEKVPPAHTVVMGGGRFQQFVGEWLVESPLSFFYAANSGTVGYALSGAIGAALAAPARTIVCCLGDGDFMMHVQELETAKRAGAEVKVVVLNDFAFGAMKARQAVAYGTTYDNPDIELLCKAFGLPGRVLSVGADVRDAVDWLLGQSGVAVLDVRMDLAENRSLLFGHDIGERE